MSRDLAGTAIRFALLAASVTGWGCEDGFEGPGEADCSEPDVDELGFSRERIEKLGNHSYQSTLQWRGPGAADLSEDVKAEDVVLNVQKTGDTKWGLHCGGYIRFPVDVELQISKKRHAKFHGQAFGRKEGLQISTSASVRVADELVAPGPAVVGEGGPRWVLYGWVDDHGARGALASETDTAAECERARWPVDRVCDDFADREEPFDAKFGEFEFGQVMGLLEQLQSQELRWEKEQSTTNVNLTFERSEGPLCVGIERSDEAAEPYRGHRLSTAGTARLKTDDGRIDVSMSVTFAVQWSKRRAVIKVPGDGLLEVEHTLVVQGHASRAGSSWLRGAPQEDDANAFQSIELSISAGKNQVQGHIFLTKLVLDDSKPQIASSNVRDLMTLDGVCLEDASRREEVDHGTFGPLEWPPVRSR
jgi:hypothetical protein